MSFVENVLFFMNQVVKRACCLRNADSKSFFAVTIIDF